MASSAVASNPTSQRSSQTVPYSTSPKSWPDAAIHLANKPYMENKLFVFTTMQMLNSLDSVFWGYCFVCATLLSCRHACVSG